MSTTNSFNTNVDDYTISELLTILNIETPTQSNVTSQTNKYMNQYKNNPTNYNFFKDMQERLMQYLDSDPPEYQPAEQQTQNWYKNEALPQNNNPTQKNKNTERKQQIDVYGNEYVPMNRNQLGVNNTFNLPVAQDTLNPNLENVISRIINLDSQYRAVQSGDNSATDYTLDLSEPLLNTLSLRLYSFQIPYTWYAIDYTYGNTCSSVLLMGVETYCYRFQFQWNQEIIVEHLFKLS